MQPLGGPPKMAKMLNKRKFENTAPEHDFAGQPYSEEQLLEIGELPKKTFTGRSRLFVGGFPKETTKTELEELFSPFGEVRETYISDKGFGFIRMVCIQRDVHILIFCRTLVHMQKRQKKRSMVK